MAQTFSLNDDSVVVVIGSGAGGGILANALAQKGIDVVCLEAGKRLQMQDIVNDEAVMAARMNWTDTRIGEGDSNPRFPLLTCKTVGGTTMHWTAAALRMQDHEFRARSTYKEIQDTNLMDWPLSLKELEPYYELAEDKLGVTGTHGIERLPGSNNYRVFEAAARNVGYKQVHTNNTAINSRPRDGRPGCIQLGFCKSGCVIGAKWSVLYTEIPKAEATGHFELRPQSMATRIDTDQQGRVRSVQYLDRQGKLQEQRTRTVCVAGNVVETTRLLLNSGNPKFPEGLANSSGQLGRNYMHHVAAIVMAVMPGEVHLYRGAQVAGVMLDETRHDPSRGFSGGFLMHISGFGPETVAKVAMPGKWGRELTAVMEQYRNFTSLIINGEDLPEAHNRISLHPTRKDQYGLPVPIVSYTHHANSKAMLRYARNAAHRMYESLGAKQIFDVASFSATHNMGTARIGDDPSGSICNPWGQTHDIPNLFISDGSLFPTASCENPTLTIIALALRQADYLAEQLSDSRI